VGKLDGSRQVPADAGDIGADGVGLAVNVVRVNVPQTELHVIQLA
jgi:hypothetical protein